MENPIKTALNSVTLSGNPAVSKSISRVLCIFGDVPVTAEIIFTRRPFVKLDCEKCFAIIYHDGVYTISTK